MARCPVCGARAAYDDTDCPACGAELGDSLSVIELEKAAPTPDAPRPPAPHRSRGRMWLVVALVIALLVVAAIVQAGRGSSSHAPRRTAGASRPVFEDATGTRLAVGGPDGVHLADLDTGRISTISPAIPGPFDSVVALTGGFVITNGRAAVGCAGKEPHACDVELGNAVKVLAASEHDWVWAVRATVDERLEVNQIDLHGQDLGQPVALPDRASVAGAVDNGLVLVSGTTLSVWDPSGVEHVVATDARFVAASGPLVAWLGRRCSADGCPLHLTDVRANRDRVINGFAESPDAVSGGRFAPGLHTLAIVLDLQTGAQRMLALVDVDSGFVRLVGPLPLVASPDGRTLAWAPSGQVVFAALVGERHRLAAIRRDGLVELSRAPLPAFVALTAVG
jgi:hypothetical protein